jgi:hypothetical protein
MPRDRSDGELTWPRALRGALLITVHPEHVSPVIVSSVDVAVAIGKTPHRTLGAVAATRQVPPPAASVDDLPAGEGLAWRPAQGESAVRFRGVAHREERRRHRRKYADGELPPERSFYFRGPDGKLNLRAQNLKIFLQVGDGLDEVTWRHHLENGDIARWFRHAIKDPELAERATALARQGLPVDEARRQMRILIEERYTEAV